jgi:hypothetical protein
MAVTQVTTAPDLGSYQQISDALNLADNPPAGLILQAFAPERLFPAADSVGMIDLLTKQGPPTAYDALELLVVK